MASGSCLKACRLAGFFHISTGAVWLSSQFQPLDDLVVFSDISPLEVIEQFSSSGDHFQQSAPGMIVLFVYLEMLGELIDALGQQRDLDLG